LEEIRTDFIRDIESRLKSRPKKYDDVVGLISEQPQVYKKTWVNKFWSFHTNSNFQLIRWHLLSDGIRDDTSQSESLYYAEPSLPVGHQLPEIAMPAEVV
jgi:hypothetical protein